MCLTDKVLCNVIYEKTTSSLWAKLESLYTSKNLSNRLYLKKQLFGLHMKKVASIHDHLSVFHKLVSDLLCVNEILKEDDKALLLLNSLPSSYEHLVTTIIYGKDTLKFEQGRLNLYGGLRRKFLMGPLKYTLYKI